MWPRGFRVGGGATRSEGVGLQGLFSRYTWVLRHITIAGLRTLSMFGGEHEPCFTLSKVQYIYLVVSISHHVVLVAPHF